VNQRRDHYRVAKLPNHCERYLQTVASAGGPGPPGAPWPPSGAPAGGNPTLDYYGLSESSVLNKSKLSTTDLLVLASMKNAAKCDK
jgi:hypothetical protein